MVLIIKPHYPNVSVFIASPSSSNPPQFVEKTGPGQEGAVMVGPRPVVTSYGSLNALLILALSTTLSTLERNREVREVLTK